MAPLFSATVGELLTETIWPTELKMLGIWPIYRINLPAPEHGDDGESQDAPCPQSHSGGIICVPSGLDFNKDICKHVFQTC